MTTLKLSKVLSAQCGVQFKQLAEILRFAHAPDLKVTVSATIQSVRAVELPAEFIVIPEWSRRIYGNLSLPTISEALRQRRLLDLHFVDSSGIEFSLHPCFALPWYDWDGRFPNTFRVGISHNSAMRISKTLEDLNLLLNNRFKYHCSQLHNAGQITTNHVLSPIPEVDLKQALDWAIEVYGLRESKSVNAAFCGRLRELPGFDGKHYADNIALDLNVSFGELARNTNIAALNQSLHWSERFATALRTLEDESFNLLITRKYLRWKTKTAVAARGTSLNSAYLEMDYSTSELGVDFEQFSDSDPKARELKSVFQSFWKKHEPTGQP